MSCGDWRNEATTTQARNEKVNETDVESKIAMIIMLILIVPRLHTAFLLAYCQRRI
jgi:hypothetical protein